MSEKINKRKYIVEYPTIMREWDYEQNNQNEVYPDQTSYGSAKKVNWICDKGHKWMASPNDRTSGRGCPICSNESRYITKTKNWLEKKGSLATNNVELAKQWHPTKNDELLPTNITVSNNKKVWWICEKGHEWEATIASRNSGSGCPVCSGHMVVVGYNDLATTNPKLILEWHMKKNHPLTPQNVTKGSDKKVWWKCEKEHEWQAQISNRTNGDGCPICSGKKVLVGYNDLQTLFPEIAKEWHPEKNILKPFDVVSKSNKKVWWICEKGHEWESSIAHRTNGRRCPICYGESRTSFPEQAIYYYLSKVYKTHNRFKYDNVEIDVYVPELKLAIEYDGAYFHGGKEAIKREEKKNKFLKQNDILLIRVKETDRELEVCENIIYTKIGPNDNELNNTIVLLVEQINKCKNINLKLDINITRDKNNIYNQYIQIEKDSSLQKLNPLIAKEWHPEKNGKLLPEHVTPSSNKKVWWLGKCGHEWEAVINSRNKGIGCPICSGKKVLVGYNDLLTFNPDIAKQWHPIKNENLTPTDVTSSSNKVVWWMCDKGHEWKTEIYHRTKGGNCPICSGKKVLSGFNDLATQNPSLAREWHQEKNGSLTPTDVTIGSDKKVWWVCENGHEWEARIYSRKKGYGCPYCTGQKTVKGVNDLQTVNPCLAKEWHPFKNNDLKPTDVMLGSNKKVWWICEKGHEWEAVISSRNAGRGCPICYKENRLKK